jgi:hypothetical protein
MKDKIKKEINKLLCELSDNDPKSFEKAIALKTKIQTLIDVLTL